MNLYRWRSNAFKQYGLGHIIVMAKTEAEARDAARMHYDQHLKNPYNEDWNALVDTEGDFIDEETKNEYLEKMAVFESDIKSEPEVIDPGILFIEGSE